MSDSEISDRAAAQSDTPGVADNRIFVLVLQHPQEKREALATAPLVVMALRNARLVTGLSWSNLARALGRRADPKRWGVLYLGSARPSEGLHREISLLGGDGE